MSAQGHDHRAHDGFPSKRLKPALGALIDAFEYARDARCDLWDFAVSIQRLHSLGVTETDLRWLVRKRYVEHAREVTRLDEDGREFRRTGDLSFCKRTCFVLTELGLAFESSHGAPPEVAPPVIESNPHAKEPAGVGVTVHWDVELRKLRVGETLVKRFKWPAANQEAILNAFQEEGWPERIDDPLPPQPDQDPKRRLSDTIKGLNRKQATKLICFHGDGTGEGILWEFTGPECTFNRIE